MAATAERLRRRLREGGAVATFLKLPTTEVVDLAVAAGFDCVVVDTEHSQLSERDARALISHAYALDLPAVVRIPAVDRGLVNRLLEAGASGVQLSMLTARQQIEELVAATRYSPAGERSVSMAHVTADYGARTLAEYVADELEAPPVLIGQIETAKTVDPLDELARSPLDAVFIGTADLSVSLNHPGEMSHPAMRTRLEAIAETCRAADLPLGAYAGSAEAIPALVGTGVSYVALGADLSMLFAKMTGEAKSAKESFGGAR